MSQIPFNKHHMNHKKMIETVRNHLAINLPIDTLSVSKVHNKTFDNNSPFPKAMSKTMNFADPYADEDYRRVESNKTK